MQEKEIIIEKQRKIGEYIKPISIGSSVWYFIVSALLIFLGLYKGIPFLTEKGIPFIIGYFIFFYIPFILLFITALVLYRKEGNSWTWKAFKQRMSLFKMTKADWFWALGLLLFCVIIYGGLSFTGKWIAEYPLLNPPDFFPSEINPNKSPIPGYMMDYKLSGQYWVPFVYLIGWFFNIFGEELLWRGMILPRQIKKYGYNGWIYHGLLWTGWHFFWYWNLLAIFPVAMAISYVMYLRRNLWIPIFAHGILNAFPLIVIVIEVFR